MGYALEAGEEKAPPLLGRNCAKGDKINSISVYARTQADSIQFTVTDLVSNLHRLTALDAWDRSDCPSSNSSSRLTGSIRRGQNPRINFVSRVHPHCADSPYRNSKCIFTVQPRLYQYDEGRVCGTMNVFDSGIICMHRIPRLRPLHDAWSRRFFTLRY